MAEDEPKVTQALARYAVGLRFEDMPAEVVQMTRHCILHQLGTAVVGSTMPWTQPVHQYVREYAGRPESTIVRLGTRVPAQDAALVNCAFGAGSGFADPFQTAPGSASGVTVPVALALAERRPLSGRDVLVAIAGGYDVLWRLQNAMMPSIMLRGFHPPSVCGVFAAAAVAGRLLRLDEATMFQALSIAASYASGTLEFDQTGGDVNIMHQGLAARNGIQSALLAQMGMTGPRMPLEGAKGIGRTFADATNWDVVTTGLGREWKVMDPCLNQYPVSGPMETPLNVFVNLVEEHSVAADQIEEVRFRISSHFLNHGANIYEPWDRASAQWSLPFSVGLRAVRGSNDLAPYCDPAAWRDPEVLGIARKVVSEAHPDAQGPRRRLTHLQVRLRDGRVLERTQEGAKGSPVDPWTPEEVRDRFRRVTSGVLPEGQQTRVLEAVDGLETMDSVGTLPALLVVK